MNENNNKPIFFDESRKRGGLLQVFAIILTVVVLGASTALWWNIVHTPSLQPITIASSITKSPRFGTPAARRDNLSNIPKDRAELRAILRRNSDLQTAKAKLKALRTALASQQTQRLNSVPTSTLNRGKVRAAFYTNIDIQGTESAIEHIDDITHLMPVWLDLGSVPGTVRSIRCLSMSNPLSADDATTSDSLTKTNDDRVIDAATQAGVAIIPVLQNFDNTKGGLNKFRGDWLKNMLKTQSNRSAVIAWTLNYVRKGKYQGINVDFETDDESDRDNITQFMTELSEQFHKYGLLVTQDIETDSDSYDVSALADVDDFMVPMLYDEHSDDTQAGSVSSISWFSEQLSNFLSQAPANKVVLGIGNYGNDWSDEGGYPKSVSYREAVQIASESRDGDDGVIKIDKQSLNPYFTYWNNDHGSNKPSVEHHVWMMDATTVYDQMLVSEHYHVLGDALWQLGYEDPTLWSFFGRQFTQSLHAFNISELNNVSFKGIGFEGAGDILQIVQKPSPGKRTLQIDPNTGRIIGENYLYYPSQWVIRSTGMVDPISQENVQKVIALTFDDGPDPRWTPRILDILQRYKVHATFFVVGECAEAHPGLVEREWNMGMEIGNHSYTHPDQISHISDDRMGLELETTQCVIESIIGRDTTLFRAPNLADSEPSTQDELVAVFAAQNAGYTFIGEKIDPTDWLQGVPPAPGEEKVTRQTIINSVLSSAMNGNCVLLHDAGGNSREETVQALPEIIEGLKAQGYRFVTVSQLMGKPKDVIFPLISPSRRKAVEFNRFMFEVTNFSGMVMNALFITTIFLGIFRVLFLGTLAVLQARRNAKKVYPSDYFPPVSVVIAAYNEEKVVNHTISTLLDCGYPNLEIVVVDDGSSDRTADVVLERYADNPAVTVIRKENGGKASALNLGVQICTGEIVVALDADTVFAKNTIRRLVRHFSNPEVGAVAGNVKVGNRGNLLTLWQTIEYITSQNFDRRAFDYLNCITVVPGAVGAWRKETILKAGGYSSDTLAEDTDLTFRIRRMGYRIVTDNSALAFTEAPDTFRGFAKQRFRWAFGTLQCLWKHRDVTFNKAYGAFGIVALPSLWIYQIAFQALAPIVDVTVLWTALYGWFVSPALAHEAMINLIAYWGLFSLVDLAGAAVAFDLDKEDKGLLGWLLLQRFVYRQMMYYVVVKSILAALHGASVGWGKLDRKGTVEVPQADDDTLNANNQPLHLDKTPKVTKAADKHVDPRPRVK